MLWLSIPMGRDVCRSKVRSPSCTRADVHGTVSICPPDCFQYKETLDVFYKIIRQEGISRLWRGKNAGLALAVPTIQKVNLVQQQEQFLKMSPMPQQTKYIWLPLKAAAAHTSTIREAPEAASTLASCRSASYTYQQQHKICCRTRLHSRDKSASCSSGAEVAAATSSADISGFQLSCDSKSTESLRNSIFRATWWFEGLAGFEPFVIGSLVKQMVSRNLDHSLLRTS